MQEDHFNNSPMKKILLSVVISFVLFSCQNKTEVENQIIADLVGMLHNKAEVKNLVITQISKTGIHSQAIHFDCTLFFTDDLYKDDGSLAFRRGMEITEKGNVFYYSQNINKPILVKIKFGETSTIKQ